MALATAMYHSEKNPLKKVSYKSGKINIPKGVKNRRIQKAFLRYHDEKNWPILREALTEMGRSDLIGDKDYQLVPAEENNKFKRRNQKVRKHR